MSVDKPSEASSESLETIAAEISSCQRCPLYQGARLGVPGSGNPHAEVMLIGEAPSAFDDRRGVPFSGPSGNFLDELLALAGLTRAEVFLTNIVKHRTPEGRGPAPNEVAACAPYLTRQISVVNPLLIVTLGRLAAGRFFTGKSSITALHGHARRVGGRIVLAMYNPAAGLHREELRQVIVDDFTRALPAALAEARRLISAGPVEGEEPPPQQLSLFQ
jgi:DNA polymerase